MIDQDDKGNLLRYHITLPNEYSIRVSYKTNTVRVYFQKDLHGITSALLTLPLNQNADITPANANRKIKTYMIFS
jgi:hypothetical protein